MLLHYLIGAAGVVLMMTIWVLVQSAWRKSFQLGGDEDVLAGRGGCGGCGHDSHCEKQASGSEHSPPADCDLGSKPVEHRV